MWPYFIFCLPLGLALGIFVFARFIAALFSEKSAEILGKRIGLHFFLGVFAVVLVLVGFFSRQLPPAWVERRSQREFAFTKIEAAGGWSAFKAECDSLISQSQARGGLHWYPKFGDPLPASCRILPTLNPRQITVIVETNKPAFVTIQIFGARSTGGRGTPYYGLFYQQFTNSDESIATHLSNSRLRFKRLTDSVFEQY